MHACTYGELMHHIYACTWQLASFFLTVHEFKFIIKYKYYNEILSNTAFCKQLLMCAVPTANTPHLLFCFRSGSGSGSGRLGPVGCAPLISSVSLQLYLRADRPLPQPGRRRACVVTRTCRRWKRVQESLVPSVQF